jgi:hypothetical protein
MIESWRKVWRDGVAPQLSTAQLEALKVGLIKDDPRLIQGQTTTPPPMHCVLNWPVEGACATAYAAWQAGDHDTVGECEEFFARTCFAADQALEEPAAVRYFLDWFDDTPRDEMRRELLAEIGWTLGERTALVILVRIVKWAWTC